MRRLSLFSLGKEGESAFSNNFCDIKIKKSQVRPQFLKVKSFKAPKTPSFKSIVLGLHSVITEPTCKHKCKCEC